MAKLSPSSCCPTATHRGRRDHIDIAGVRAAIIPSRGSDARARPLASVAGGDPLVHLGAAESCLRLQDVGTVGLRRLAGLSRRVGLRHHRQDAPDPPAPALPTAPLPSTSRPPPVCRCDVLATSEGTRVVVRDSAGTPSPTHDNSASEFARSDLVRAGDPPMDIAGPGRSGPWTVGARRLILDLRAVRAPVGSEATERRKRQRSSDWSVWRKITRPVGSVTRFTRRRMRRSSKSWRHSMPRARLSPLHRDAPPDVR